MRHRLILLLAVIACGGDDNATEPPETPLPVATVTVSPETSTIAPGGVLQLQATIQDSAGRTLTGREITWTSSDAGVATVSPTGSVTGIVEGSATLTAASEGRIGTATVAVLRPVANVAIEPGGAAIAPGGGAQLSAVTRDAAGDVLTGRVVTWASSAPSVATVSPEGLVRGVAPGEAEITATSEGVTSASVPITVALDFAEMGAGNARTCGLTRHGVAFCWGLNNAGQLGNGSAVASATPVPVGDGLIFRTVVSGGEGTHTCGITTLGEAHCWGNNDVGQLGDGTTTSRSLPVQVAGGLKFTSLSVHATHTCGLTDSGLAYCWGGNDSGELGIGSTSSSSLPLAVAGGKVFTSIATGYHHTCAVASGGTAWCWGGNFLGDGTSTPSNVPVAVAGGHTFADITAGSFHTCGLTPDGIAYCWGFDALGDGTTDPSLIPMPVSGGHVFASLSAGFANTCGVTDAGAGYCWGDNAMGQTGTGTSGNALLVPTAVVGGIVFSRITVGALHTCGFTSNRIGYCWGSNSSGQLGDGSTTQSNVPVKVTGQF